MRALKLLALSLALFGCDSTARAPIEPSGPRADASAVSDATTTASDAAPAADAQEGTPDAGPAPDAPSAPDAAPPQDAGPATVMVTFEVTVPASTPAGDPVHVAGNFQAWSPSDPNFILRDQGNGVHTITLPFTVGQTLAFKFVRGDWARVEKGPNGEEIQDRTLTVTAAGTQQFTVASWADGSPVMSTRVGNVTDLQVPGFLNGRRVWVYLPPGYASSTARYPVLYMLDGQNVFDARTSFAGEWQVDEALEALIPTGQVTPLIVVAVDNGGATRFVEYTPWVGTYRGMVGGGEGEAHLQAIITTLKPWVDATYRTRPDAANTGFSGSSLGGLMSVYAAYAHGDVFGRVGAVSPSIWWSNERLVDFVDQGARPPVVRLWTDMGALEGYTPALNRLSAALVADGFVVGQDLRVEVIPGAAHNEAAWSARFPEIVRYLFPGP